MKGVIVSSLSLCLSTAFAFQDYQSGNYRDPYNENPPEYGEARPPGPGQSNIAAMSKAKSYCVYNSLVKIFEALREMPEIFDIAEVKSLYERQNKDLTSKVPKKGRQPFIVIEGFKGSGKSATSRKFAASLNGTYLRSPPPYLEELKSIVVTKPRMVRSAFHALVNYILAEQVKDYFYTSPVVVDQYWHGLTAFALTKLAVFPNNLPFQGSPIYRFPKDLLVPDIAFFIYVNDESRLFRIPDTGRPATSKLFRATMSTAYRRMEQPRLLAVNGDRERNMIEESLWRLTYEHIGDMLPET